MCYLLCHASCCKSWCRIDQPEAYNFFTCFSFRFDLFRQDPYGNYVVQYVLGICEREEADTLVTVPLGKVMFFLVNFWYVWLRFTYFLLFLRCQA